MSEATDMSTAKSTELDVKGWNERWQQGKTGFHRSETHPLLERYLGKLLGGQTGLKVFVPLCGKTLDMKWLSDAGHTVVGVEGSEQAILEFFSEQKLEYTKEPLSDLHGDVFKSKDGKTRIYKCDFFQFEKCKEADFDAVWDRGSLVAINVQDRQQYGDVIKTLCSPKCRILIVTVDYTRDIWPGPPHLVPDDQVEDIFGDQFSVEKLLKQDSLDEHWRSRGMTEFHENVFLLCHK